MGVRPRRIWSDVAISLGALTVLAAVLVSIDDRVRERIGAMAAGDTASIASGGEQLRGFAVVLVDAARTQSLEHAPMVLFVATLTVLVLWMLRV